MSYIKKIYIAHVLWLRLQFIKRYKEKFCLLIAINIIKRFFTHNEEKEGIYTYEIKYISNILLHIWRSMMLPLSIKYWLYYSTAYIIL